MCRGGKNSRSVVWNRQFGLERFDNMFVRYNTCKELQSTLRMLGVRQLVVGHTVQVLLWSSCSEQLGFDWHKLMWRISCRRVVRTVSVTAAYGALTWVCRGGCSTQCPRCCL